MKNAVYLPRVHGCLLGVAIGDALGMPVETMTHLDIHHQFGVGGITGFIDPVARREWLNGLKAGDTTDDWQLTRAVATSLIRTSKTFDMHDCATEHVRELEKSLFGWGKTTEDSIQAIRAGTRLLSRDMPAPAEPGKGCGNGVIMKVSPIAIAELLNRGVGSMFWSDVRALGMITHPDIRASIAAYAVAYFIKELLIAKSSLSSTAIMALLELVICEVEIIEQAEKVTTDRVSDRLRLIYPATESADLLRRTVGCGFYALDTAAFAIGTFIRHPFCFRTAVLEAVNAGRDTDTNASVVGALVGAHRGINGIPHDWLEFGRSALEARDLAEQLCS